MDTTAVVKLLKEKNVNERVLDAITGAGLAGDDVLSACVPAAVAQIFTPENIDKYNLKPLHRAALTRLLLDLKNPNTILQSAGFSPKITVSPELFQLVCAAWQQQAEQQHQATMPELSKQLAKELEALLLETRAYRHLCQTVFGSFVDLPPRIAQQPEEPAAPPSTSLEQCRQRVVETKNQDPNSLLSTAGFKLSFVIPQELYRALCAKAMIMDPLDGSIPPYLDHEWHTLICQTQAYRWLCLYCFGRFLEHTGQTMSDSVAVKNKRVDTVVENYTQLYSSAPPKGLLWTREGEDLSQEAIDDICARSAPVK